MKSDLAIVGGTGFDQIDELVVSSRRVVRTPYGEPSGVVVEGALGRRTFLFLPRHGVHHRIPPHLVNYRANLWALHECGARRVIAFAAVGAIDSEHQSGDVVIPDQLIDYTWGREHTYSDGSGESVQHVDVTNPYSMQLRKDVMAAAKRAGVNVANGGCYAATQGPRLETAAEINRLENDGATIVGMTGMPEAALARELAIEYACVAIVVNPAAGRGVGEITMDEIRKHLISGAEKGKKILRAFR